jgi:phosphoribosylamine--glycine ligase
MEKAGILVVCYGSRETAMVDAFARSRNYHVELYVVDKQLNPFNLEKATKHIVIPDLNIEEICRFAEANKDHIDFGIVGPEKPIIEGVRDLVEKRTQIPIICPTKACALEESKVRQRLLFREIVPEANPRFKVFDPHEYAGAEDVEKAVYGWVNELGTRAVVKPDRPTAGKGVGVWGDHFNTREQLFDYFMSNYECGTVLIEEKVEGEESSFMAFCDGKHLVPLPDTRDHKRAFDNDRGPNTGGMGSYKDAGDTLPFMTPVERDREVEIAQRILAKLREETADLTGLRGVPLYLAFMHTGTQSKILEDNSRPGDPEIINLLPLLKDDFVDVCFKMIEGNLTRIEFEKMASVVTYKAPPSYGGYAEAFPSQVKKSEVGGPADLTKAYELGRKHNDRIRVYPASMELRGNETYALKSRAVAVVGMAENIEEARQLSLEGINAIRGGALWSRTDIASKQSIGKSVQHMQALRRRK